MEKFFSALLTPCAGNSPVTGEFLSQRPATRSFYVFFDPRLNKLLSKQSRRRWFETPPHPLLRHCNVWAAVKFTLHLDSKPYMRLPFRYSLQWRHNEHGGFSSHEPHQCLLSRLFRRRLLAFVRGIHWGPLNSPHKWPVTRKMFPLDDVIIW